MPQQFWEDCLPVEATHLAAGAAGLLLMRPTLRKFTEDCLPGRDPMVSQGEGSSPTAVKKISLTETPMPCRPALLVERREGLGEKGVLRAYFTFHYPPLILLVINSLYNVKVGLFCP